MSLLQRFRGVRRPAPKAPRVQAPPFTLVFLHIPKTAGISLRDVILARMEGRPRFRILNPIDDARKLRALPAAQRAALGLVEGHLYYGIHEVLPRPCVYMTMLRDPVERVLSYYSFVREWEPHHLHRRVNDEGLSLARCFEMGLTVEMDNFMVRALTSLRNIHVPFGGVTREMLGEARAHLESIAALGITEEFGASLAYFGRLLGWPPVPEPRSNTTAKRLKRDELSPGELGVIREHNALDIELYAYARRLFRARLDGEAGVPTELVP